MVKGVQLFGRNMNKEAQSTYQQTLIFDSKNLAGLVP
jgi:hypothetical protein